MSELQEAPSRTDSRSKRGRYAHIVEESVHPFQALCGFEFYLDES